MNIGLLGFGVVGRGVYDMLAGRDDIRAAWVRCGCDFGELTARTTYEMQDILDDPAVDTVVEVMGGLPPAYENVAAARRARPARVGAAAPFKRPRLSKGRPPTGPPPTGRQTPSVRQPLPRRRACRGRIYVARRCTENRGPAVRAAGRACPAPTDTRNRAEIR